MDDRWKPPTASVPQSERRSQTESRTDGLCVRLTRKYADMIDGVNLEHASVGDRLDLPRRDAEILIAEGWAERSEARSQARSDERSEERRVRLLPRRAIAADNSHRPRKKSKA